MKILLTGGTGYIASHTAITLIEAGYEVVLYDNLFNSSAETINRISNVTGVTPIFFNGDIRDTKNLEEVMRNNKTHLVLHFAGLKSVGESTRYALDYYDNNVYGTISLLKAMRAAGCNKLVFSSSATVYGNPEYLPIDEEHPTNPTNPYGRTKLQAEELLRDTASSEKNWRIVCLRYFNPVGAHFSGLLGEASNGIPGNLVPYICQVASGKIPYLSVFGDDYSTTDGTGVRDYIHIMDLSEGHLAALKSLLTMRETFEVFNLGTGTGYSVFEIITMFENITGQIVPFKVTNRRMGDVASCYAKVNKAREIISWGASRTLEDMCASAWKFQNMNKS